MRRSPLGKSPSRCSPPAPTRTPVSYPHPPPSVCWLTDMRADLASAYIVSPVSRPDLALHHLQYACPHRLYTFC